MIVVLSVPVDGDHSRWRLVVSPDDGGLAFQGCRLSTPVARTSRRRGLSPPHATQLGTVLS